VIAPTRELVVQIAEEARLLGQATPFNIHAVSCDSASISRSRSTTSFK